MAKIRLLLVESRDIFREGFKKVCQRANNIELVSACTSYEETLQNVIKLQPDVIFVGLGVSGQGVRGGDRVKLIHMLKELYPDKKVIIAVPPTYDYIFEPLKLLKTKADGFLSGGLDAETLHQDLIIIFKGHTIVPAIIGGILRDEFVLKEKRGEAILKSGLSEREQEVLSLIAKGFQNKEISNALFITQNTVNVHVNNILKKMKVKNRQQAVLKSRSYYLSKGNA
jgi:two-component system response regulator DegU